MALPGRPWVHESWRCDGCQAHPVKGHCYTSKRRRNYCLCSKCQRQKQEEDLVYKLGRERGTRPLQVHCIDCDKCGVSPIEGPRYQHQVKQNFNLCADCFSEATTSDAEERKLFDLVEHTAVKSMCKTHQPVFHFNVQCDECSVTPICGPFYNSVKNPGYDLCLACFEHCAGIGMIGFGFTDNAIMIIAGDAIQNSIGGVLGLTPLLSAGLGNAVADLVGTALRGYIEAASSRFMPEIRISAIQMTYKEAWWADTVGSSIGVTVGCLLGLVPLFIIRPGSGPVPEDAMASASGADNASKDVVWCAEKQQVECTAPPADVGKTIFASVSSSSTSHSMTAQQTGKMSHRLGGPVLILIISVFMALRRLRDRSHSRQRRMPRSL